MKNKFGLKGQEKEIYYQSHVGHCKTNNRLIDYEQWNYAFKNRISTKL